MRIRTFKTAVTKMAILNLLNKVICFEISNYSKDGLQDHETFLEIQNITDDSGKENSTIIEGRDNIGKLATMPIALSNTSSYITTVEDDDFDHTQVQNWKYKEVVKGYEILSDNLKFTAKLLTTNKVLQIRIDTGSARTMEKRMHRRNIELKIGTWNKVNRVRVRVPFGFQPQELSVFERPRCIEIYAPYDFIEFANGAGTISI